MAHERQPRVGEVVWRAAIGLGIGDDDTIEAVAESEHDSEQAAKAWVERELPRAVFPEWVLRRQHGAAGAFLYGTVEQGWYVEDTEHGVMFEPDPDVPGWDADLVAGVLQWRPSP